MRFEWDEAKAAANLAKHGISFSAAARALMDPGRIEDIDDRNDYEEERVQAICLSGGRILFVVYTMRNDAIRIISARKATRHEQERYIKG